MTTYLDRKSLPSLYREKVAADQTIPHSSWTDITFDGVESSGGAADVITVGDTTKITVSEDGDYNVHATICFRKVAPTTTPTQQVRTSLYFPVWDAGVPQTNTRYGYSRSIDFPNTNDSEIEIFRACSATIPMTAGQQVSVRVFQTNFAAETVDVASTANAASIRARMSVTKVSPS